MGDDRVEAVLSSLFRSAATYIGVRIFDDLVADPAVWPSSMRSPSGPVTSGSMQLIATVEKREEGTFPIGDAVEKNLTIRMGIARTVAICRA